MSAWKRAAASGGSIAKTIASAYVVGVEGKAESGPAAAVEAASVVVAPSLPSGSTAPSTGSSSAPTAATTTEGGSMSAAGAGVPSTAPSSGAGASGGKSKSGRKGEHWNVFSEAVQLIISEWPILRTALQQQSAGSKTRERFDDMLDVLLENLVEVWDEGDSLSWLSVFDYLEEVLDTDLNVDFDGDAQLQAVSRQVEKLFNDCAAGKPEPAQALIKVFEERLEQEAEEARAMGAKGGSAAAAGEDHHDDDDDEEEEEGDDGWARPKGGKGKGGAGAGSGAASPAAAATGGAGAGSAAVSSAAAAYAAPASKADGEDGDEDDSDDDGWKVVAGGKGRKGK